MAKIAELEDGVAATKEWLGELKRRLNWEQEANVYLASMATLHALRDHLPTTEVARLGTALPPLLRGLYYEGWRPRGRPAAQISREAFFSRINEGVHRDPGIDAEAVSRAVFALLVERTPAAEIEEIEAATPASLHGLWPN